MVADASDGVQALEHSRRHLPDMILVDINMPNMDGLELIEKLNNMDKNILVIVVTGYSDFTYAQKALRLGVFDYFLKPIMEEPFFSTLDKAKRFLVEQKHLNDVQDQLKETSDFALNQALNLLSLNIYDQQTCLNKLQFLKQNLDTEFQLLIIYPGMERDYQQPLDLPSSEEEEIPFLIRNRAVSVLKEEDIFLSFVNSSNYSVCLAKHFDGQKIEDLKGQVPISVETYMIEVSSFENLPRDYLKALALIRKQTQYSLAIQQTINYIKQEYSNKSLSLTMISEACNISPGHLGRLCKLELHRTPMGYLSHYRITKAARLLSDNSLKIYEVAEKVGYTSQHYFSNAFKKIMGQPPREYRNSLEPS